MAQLTVPAEPAPGVTIDQTDGKITITITATSPSDDKETGALWHEAYMRLHTEHTEELESFGDQARIFFPPLPRRNSSGTLSRSVVSGWHNPEPKTVLNAVYRWISEGGEPDGDKSEEEDKVRRALASTKALLGRNMQKSPSAHLAWAAAALCIQKLVEESRSPSESSGLAYIVARIAFYDRLTCLVSRVPEDAANRESTGDAVEEDDNATLREALVDLYTAILKQLIVVIAPGSVPREKSAQQQKWKLWDDPGVGSTGVDRVIAPESSLEQHAGDKLLEESITELVRLRAPPRTPSDEDGRDDAGETANDTLKEDDDDDGSHSDRDQRDGNQNDESKNAGSNDNSNANRDDSGQDNSSAIPQSKIQKLLCVAPLRPPSLPPPPDGLPGLLGSLYDWVSGQDAYQRWREACSAEDAKSPADNRILRIHGPEGSGITMVLHALAQVEEKGRDEGRAKRPRRVVAHAFWDWSRDAHGTSVVSVVRDLVWTLLAAQPNLQSHLTKALKEARRRRLLGGGNVDGSSNDDNNNTEALYAALGTSCDFYSLLVLLCSIVRDPLFAPTCFVVDHMDVLLSKDGEIGEDGDETHKNGRSRTALKRAWTLRDLFALIHTTCRLSDKVAWIVASSSSSLGGCCLSLTPEDPTLGEITHRYVRALLLSRLSSAYSSDMLDQLASEVAHHAGSNVAWIRLAADLLSAVRLPWNAAAVLERLPPTNSLGPLLDWIVQDAGSDQAHVETVLSVAACAFRPLTVSELGALAELPATVDATLLVTVLARPLLELREVDDGRDEKAQMCVYFTSQAALAAQRARLAKGTAAPSPDAKPHADMARRHIHCLMRHYDEVRTARSGKGDSKEAGRGQQLSLYMKLAWLRHLDRVDLDCPDVPLADDVRLFAERHAGLWLRDLEALGAFAVAGRLLQDLLPSAHRPPSLIRAALQTIFTVTVRQKMMDMPFAETSCFLRMAGHKPNNAFDDDDDDDDDTPVLPQDPPVQPDMLSLDSGEMAASAAHIATLQGHEDWVNDVCWAYGGRLLVSISGDGTLRCWDRASLRVQHVTSHQLTGYWPSFAVCLDPSMLVAINYSDVVQFDLAAGAVVIKRKSLDEVEIEAQKAEEGGNCKDGGDDADDGVAADEEPLSFSNLHLGEDGSNDVIVTSAVYIYKGQMREVALTMPELHLKKVPLRAHGYGSLPDSLASRLPASDYKDAAVATELGLAAAVHNNGHVEIYDTRSAVRLYTLRCAQAAFKAVQYDSLWHVFVVSHKDDSATFYFVQEGEEEQEGEERESTKPLIRSYRASEQLMISYLFSRDREEAVFAFHDSNIEMYKVVEMDVDTVDIIHVDGASAERASDATAQMTQLTFTLLSHNGRWVATADRRGQIQLWDLDVATSEVSNASGASGATLLRTIRSGQPEINWLSFSSDDTLLLSCYDNGEIDVWEREAGKRVAVLGGHEVWVYFAAFAPGDKLVATTSYNGLVRLWDLDACRALFLEKDGDVGAFFVENDRKSDDNNDDNNDNGTADTTKQIFISFKKDVTPRTLGTVAFSPDGRFLATSGRLGHIWDISPAPDSILPAEPPTLCVPLSWEDPATQKRPQDDDDDDDDDDDVRSSASLVCSSFVFSPDSRSLFGFCEDGRLLVWTRTLHPSSSSADRWQPQAAALARGFEVPGRSLPWDHIPLHLSISGTDGHYLLHSEIGVWTLPSSPSSRDADDESSKSGTEGLRFSPRNPCTVASTGSHMAIYWQDRLVASLPEIYAPYSRYFFSSLTCGVRDGTSLVIGTRAGRLFYYRFRGKETKAGDGKPGFKFPASLAEEVKSLEVEPDTVKRMLRAAKEMNATEERAAQAKDEATRADDEAAIAGKKEAQEKAPICQPKKAGTFGRLFSLSWKLWR